MISLPVTLRHSEHQQQPASAVLLPGDNPRHWITSLNQAFVPLDGRVFLPLSDSQHNVVGAVCTVPEESIVRFDERLPRYGVVARRVYLPVEAVCDPPLTANDWNAWLPADGSVFVWHPYLGLVRFEEHQQLRAVELLLPPSERRTDWTAAVPGSVLNTRLHSLQADTLPSIEAVMQSGQGDIGSKSDKQSELPPAAGESKWKSIAAAPLLPFAAMANWLAKQFSKGKGSQAADSRRENPGLQNEREREIQRLLQKLKDDPDEGLKYALPMGTTPGRGVAPPGSKLGRRNVDFRLPSGGGGPADSWRIRFELQQQLFARYREAAEREVRLGRYRRAAYIHAELLGNFAAAANVLEQGQHYHEAAVLYRDKLNRPIDAARCLERGGLLHEAIEIYAGLNQHVKVGELYERLDDADAAHAAYRRAVDERLSHEDRLAAADLLLKKLDETDEALEILENGWPDRTQRVSCLKKFFELTSQHGHHARAAAKVDELRNQRLPPDRLLDLTVVLSGVATSSPDRAVAVQAADATRVVAASHLGQTPRPALGVLQAVAKLASQDRLLQRDCVRFGRPKNIPGPPSKVERPSALTRLKAELVGSIPLPKEYEWICAESVGDHFYLLGHDGEKTLALIRGLWGKSDSIQWIPWTGRGVEGGQVTTFLGADDPEQHSVKIVRLNRPGLPPKYLPATSRLSRTVAETPGWVPLNILGFTVIGATSWIVDPELVITAHNRDGVTTSHIDLLQEVVDRQIDRIAIEAPLPMHARTDCLYVATGSTLYRLTTNGPVRSLDFPGRILSIGGSLPHTRERILVLHETGASLLFPDIKEFHERVIEDQATELQGTFLRDGRVVLCPSASAAAGEIKVYATANSQAVFQGAAELPAQRSVVREWTPLALLKTDVATHFAMIPRQRGSNIEIFHLPERR